MIEALISADKECTKRRDIAPDKVLRPIGTIWREWIEPNAFTELPGWMYWRVKGYVEVFKWREGDTIYYERHEEIEATEPP